MLRATLVTAEDTGCVDTVTLDYEGRYRRRIAMASDGGLEFLLDLAQVTELQAGQGLLLEDGRLIGVRAADEDLMEARPGQSTGLVRTAWHVGNRHLPCEITEDALILRWDHVIAEMLEGLGCSVTRTRAAFTPEGGAYGQGRTHGHSH